MLLWPATYSVPQRMLRLAEKFLNQRDAEKARFRFHPPEISQLQSTMQGRTVLSRNHFQAFEADGGLKSLMAFISLVGKKR